MFKRTHKGFTLIELMIVVVILGILMSSVLPKLTGAQARARDTARVADLGNVAAALQVYYDDYGEFPGSNAGGPAANQGNGYCLDGTDAVSTAISGYLKGKQIPKDPSKGANGYLCGTTGFFWYQPLTKSSVVKNSYALCSDMETFQKANTITGTGAGFTTQDGSNDVAVIFDPTVTSYETASTAVNQAIGGDTLTSDTTDQRETIFCITAD